MSTGFVLNLPEHGHMNATFPLVSELAARGDRLVYFATERFRARIEAAGATFASYGGDDARFDPPAHAGGLYSVMAYLMGLAEELLPELLRRIEAERPDYLLIDSMCVWGRLAQQVTGIPAVTLASVFVPDDERVSLDEMVNQAYGQAPRELLLAGIDALNTYLQCSQRVDRRHGTRSPNLVEFFANRQPLNVVFTSRLFHPAGEHYDDRYVFVGPSIAPRADDDEAGAQLLARIDGLRGGGVDDDAGVQRPLIYISLGTIFNDRPEFFRACFEAFGDGPWHVVVSVGDRLSREALGPVPANILVEPYVPQLPVLARAALCLTHGGMNTTSEALWHGVPLLLFPQHGDQHLVTARVTTLGAGLRITPPDVQPDRLRALAERVLADPEIARRADDVSASFTASGGHQRAADAIRAHLARVPAGVGAR